jgi:lysozyme
MNINPKFVDLSHYDNLKDIGQVKGAGMQGVVNKATEGPGMVDKTFAIRRPVVLGAGLLYGGYHFLRPGDQVQAAEHFLNAVGDVADLLLMGDWEVKDVSVEAAKQWFGTVKDKTKRWPVCYSYAAMLMEMFGHNADPVFAQTRLWIACYSLKLYWPTQIWQKPWAWQFTGDGNGPEPHWIPGIELPGSKGLDVNSYDGSDDQLRAEWAS